MIKNLQTWLARAEPDLGELEGAYRQHFLQSDAMQIRQIIPFYLLGLWLFAVVDFQLYGWSIIFFLLLLTRLIFTIGAWWFNQILQTMQIPKVLDRWLLILGLFVLIFAVVVNYTRSVNSFYNASISVLLVITTYLMIPNRLAYRCILALTFSFGEILIYLLLRGGFNTAEVRSNMLALLLANLIGFVLSVRFYTFRRQQYKAQFDEALARAEIERLASTDTLTNVANRRHFLELANQELLRFKRKQHGFCLLYLDIDFFKRINDTYGHGTGDLVLQKFAGLVSSQIRAVDIFGRLGGEEFALLLPETPVEAAKEVAERIRLACQNMSTEVDSKKLEITVSAGLTVSQSSDSSIDEILHRADQGLYQAKQLGRNRIEIV
jgi:diguanylate cyclase (GGDEF)-like protein